MHHQVYSWGKWALKKHNKAKQNKLVSAGWWKSYLCLILGCCTHHSLYLLSTLYQCQLHEKGKNIRVIMKIVMTFQTSERILGFFRVPRNLSLRTAGLGDDVPVKDHVGQSRFIMCCSSHTFQPLLLWGTWGKHQELWGHFVWGVSLGWGGWWAVSEAVLTGFSEAPFQRTEEAWVILGDCQGCWKILGVLTIPNTVFTFCCFLPWIP